MRIHPKTTLSGTILSLFIMIIVIGYLFAFTYSAHVVVDGSIEYQSIDGWGITHFLDWNWEGPNRYPIPEKDVMYQIKNLGIDYVANYDNTLLGKTHEKKNDDNDPFHYNWDSYNAQLVDMKYIFERLLHQQRAGLKYYLASHGKPSWMYDKDWKFDSGDPNMVHEFAEYWAALCIYARKNFSLSIPFISLQIEPTWALKSAAKQKRRGWLGFRPAELRDAIKTVGARLRQEGFNTMILAPDDASAEATKKMCRTILRDPAAKSYMNCIAFHPYDNFSGKNDPDKAIPALTGLAKDKIVRTSGLPLYQTEWTLAWAYGDRMRDHVDEWRFALDYVKMIYNCHTYGNTSLYVVWSSQYDWGYDVDKNGRIEKEGMFGPGVVNGKLRLKKYGHALSQYTQHIPPGSKRIYAELSGTSNVFVTAYKHLKKGMLTLVFINKNKSPVNTTVNFNHIPDISNFKVIRTSKKENRVESNPITLSDTSFTTVLLDSSVTTFIGQFKTP